MASAGDASVPEERRQRSAAEADSFSQWDRDGRFFQTFVSGFLFVVSGLATFFVLINGSSAWSEHIELSNQFCMNTYGELIDWILSHVTDADMFIVQSAVTCGALFWFAHPSELTCKDYTC